MSGSIEIPVKGLFSAKECLWFLDRGFDDCMYELYHDKIRRAFKSMNEIVLVDIYLLPNKILVKCLSNEPSDHAISAVVNFIADWFDLNTDMNAFYQVIAADKRLAYMSEKFYGLH